jgi:hypothetical protein
LPVSSSSSSSSSSSLSGWLLCCVSVIVIAEPEIALETALSNVRRRLKKNECAGVRSCELMAARPLREAGSMGGSCRRDPFLRGAGNEVDGSTHEK